MHGTGWFSMGWMGLVWLLALIACVVAVGWILVSYTSSPGRGESPEKALQKRYARGDITRETYERMLEDLRR